MDIGVLRRFIAVLKPTILNLTIDEKSKQFETELLTRIVSLFSDSTTDNSIELSQHQKKTMINLFHDREKFLRRSENLSCHYMMMTRQSDINIHYIKLAYAFHRSYAMDFLAILLNVKNTKCLNVENDIHSSPDLTGSHPNIELYNRLRLLDHYNFIGCESFSQADTDARACLIELVVAEIFFDPPERRARGGSYGQTPSTNRVGTYYLRPELQGLYFYKNDLYSIAGLLHLNLNLNLNQNLSTPFCTRSPDRSLRPISIFEMYFIRQKTITEDTLTYKIQSYPSVYEWMRAVKMKNWKDLYRDPYPSDLLFNLIELYLNNSKYDDFITAFDDWCDRLITPEHQGAGLNWIHKINSLYGQIIGQEVINVDMKRSLYLIDVLVAIRYEKFGQEDYLDHNMSKLLVWYCVHSENLSIENQRIKSVMRLFDQYARLNLGEEDRANSRYKKSANYLITHAKHLDLPNAFSIDGYISRFSDYFMDDNKQVITLKDSFEYYCQTGQFNKCYGPPQKRKYVEFTSSELKRIENYPSYKSYSIEAQALKLNDPEITSLLKNNLFPLIVPTQVIPNTNTVIIQRDVKSPA